MLLPIPLPESQNDALLCIIIDHIKQYYAQDISLVLLYGSAAREDTTPFSDLDVVFIPRTERGYKFGQTFILADIGYDFYPIDWARIERQADGKEAYLTYLLDTRLLYAAAPEDEKYYRTLQEKAEVLAHAGLTPESIQRAKSFLELAYAEFGHTIMADNLMEARLHASMLLERIADALHVMNGRYDRPGRNWPKALYVLPECPDCLEEMIDSLVKSNSLDALATSARHLLLTTSQCHKRVADRFVLPVNPAVVIPGMYEEMRSNWHHKIIAAIESNDAIQTFAAACAQQRMLNDVIARAGLSTINFLGEFCADNLPSFASSLAQMENDLRILYTQQGLTIHEYASLKEYKQALATIASSK